ncbi:protein BTG2-like [Huso huso]|uniref:Protein BTG2-like n=1 Tax=Huso huso TaxID=61971 RepID=A0ABR0YHP0_HUSHU
MDPQCFNAKAEMVPETTAAAGFIASLLRTRGFLTELQLQKFSKSLQEALADHYKQHWFPDRPQKGSGYRCIRINHEMDPLIGKSASRIGLSSQQLFHLLPKELTLWIDPFEVSYRIGEDGSTCVLYETEAPAASASSSNNASAYNPMLMCKQQLLMGRRSPPKNYLMTVSS